MKTVLHICCNFTGNKVHSNLVYEMAKMPETMHHVFVPCSNRNLIGKNNINKDNVNVVYFYIPRLLRFFPILKSILIFFMIFFRIRKMDIEPLYCRVFAYTFWSDGVVAFYFNKFLKVKFIVAVRSTDFNVFFKYGYHLKPILRKIYSKASHIYSPNVIYKKLMLNEFKCDKKVVVVPNPLSRFWLDDIPFTKSTERNNLIFVGDFNSNKNIVSVCLAIEELLKEYPKLNLTCVGGSVSELKELLKVDDLPTYINVLGYLNDSMELKSLYRKHIALVVPSFNETFGMVYLEALSQGCKIVYSKDQGVDGFFSNDQGAYAINPYDLEDLKKTIKEVVNNKFTLDSLSLASMLSPFSSNNISQRLYDLLAFDENFCNKKG